MAGAWRSVLRSSRSAPRPSMAGIWRAGPRQQWNSPTLLLSRIRFSRRKTDNLDPDRDPHLGTSRGVGMGGLKFLMRLPGRAEPLCSAASASGRTTISPSAWPRTATVSMWSPSRLGVAGNLRKEFRTKRDQIYAADLVQSDGERSNRPRG